MAEVTGKASSRIYRLCFRTTRPTYYWLRDMAAEHGWTTSTLVYWMVDHCLEQIAGSTIEERLEVLKSHLGPSGLERFEKDVEKGLSTEPDQDVPW